MSVPIIHNQNQNKPKLKTKPAPTFLIHGAKMLGESVETLKKSKGTITLSLNQRVQLITTRIIMTKLFAVWEN